MIAFSPDDRRESFIIGGWNLSDDDVPRPPEVIHQRTYSTALLSAPLHFTVNNTEQQTSRS